MQIKRLLFIFLPIFVGLNAGCETHRYIPTAPASTVSSAIPAGATLQGYKVSVYDRSAEVGGHVFPEDLIKSLGDDKLSRWPLKIDPMTTPQMTLSVTLTDFETDVPNALLSLATAMLIPAHNKKTYLVELEVSANGETLYRSQVTERVNRYISLFPTAMFAGEKADIAYEKMMSSALRRQSASFGHWASAQESIQDSIEVSESTGDPVQTTRGEQKRPNVSDLVLNNTNGAYMNPWTSDGVLADWVNKAINAEMGSTVGSTAGTAVGAAVADKVLESVPFGGFIGGFLGSQAGEAVGREVTIDRDYIRRTSDQSFRTLYEMARYLEATYAGNPNYVEAINAANEIYPGLREAIAQ